MEGCHDIPTKTRQKWLTEAIKTTTKPTYHRLIQQAIRRLANVGKQAKYPFFYSVQPLVNLAFASDQNALPLVDRLLLQLRLTTMMRSGDCAKIVCAIFEQDAAHFVQTTNKMGHRQTFSVTGHTLTSLTQYLWQIRGYPNLHLFRHTAQPAKCLGPERLAKRLLTIMQDMGIDTQTFKAHSLRGATATHLMRTSTPQRLIQSRGGWTSQQTLDMYYNRLHQTKDWEQILQGQNADPQGENDKCRQSAQCLVLATTSAPPETDEGRWRGADEETSTRQCADLRALGILRPLYDHQKCSTCRQPMTHEAKYACSRCRRQNHVRCMTQAHGSTYHTMCTMCYASRDGDGSGSLRPGSHLKGDEGLITDVMGVCD